MAAQSGMDDGVGGLEGVAGMEDDGVFVPVTVDAEELDTEDDKVCAGLFVRDELVVGTGLDDADKERLDAGLPDTDGLTV